MIKAAILKETKTPPDKRVAITPRIAEMITQTFGNIELVAQQSDLRCFSDTEYHRKGIKVVQNVSDADILIGVKEVKIDTLLPNKKYMFFAHVAKKQAYNRELLQAVLRKNITLIDYEYLVNENNIRVVAFGRWAGIVGAYNGLRAWGLRTKAYTLPNAADLKDLAHLKTTIKDIKLPPVKLLITGEGRVASGAAEVFDVLNLRKVSAREFKTQSFNEPVLCQIGPKDYVKRKDGAEFDLMHFFKNPKEYKSTFLPFTKVTDLFIPCHFWDNNSPAFMLPQDQKAPDFNIKVIADVSCDIKDPIPSTVRASTIAEPFYDFNPLSGEEEPAFSSHKNITVMAVDNLPGSLPRDASEDFSATLYKTVFPALFSESETDIIEKATIAKNGKLTERYAYLQAYAEGKE